MKNPCLQPAPLLALRGIVGTKCVGPTAFGNALGQGLVDSMQPTQGQGPWSSADYRNGADIDSDNFSPAMAYGYRNGMDVESDAFKPAMAYGYRNGMDVESDAFNPASALGYRNGMDVASDAYNGSRRPITSSTRGQSQGGQAGAWSRRTGEGGPVWHPGSSPGRNAPTPLSGMQRAKAHALGVYDAGAGAVEGSGYSFGVVGTPESRAAWAQQAAKAGVEGIRRLINDPSGTVSGWWDNLTGDDPEAIRQATAQGAGVAMGVGGGVALGRLQGTPLGRAGKVGSAADALSGLSSNQLAALRNAGLGDAEIALQIQTLGDVQLFRGTTPGFPGNPVLQQLGITPASTDPLVATVFALEGKAIGGNAVVLAGGMRKFAAGDMTSAMCEPRWNVKSR